MPSSRKIDVSLLEVPIRAYQPLAALGMILPRATVLSSLGQSIETRLKSRQIICRQRKRGTGLEVVGEFKSYLLALRMQNNLHSTRYTAAIRILRENEPYSLTALDAEIAEALALRAYVTCAETFTALVMALSDASRMKLFGQLSVSQRRLAELSRLPRGDFQACIEPTQPAGVWPKIVSLNE